MEHIAFCSEEHAGIFNRKRIKTIATKFGLTRTVDFDMKRVEGGWKAFCIVSVRRTWWLPEGKQSLFWCAEQPILKSHNNGT